MSLLNQLRIGIYAEDELYAGDIYQFIGNGMVVKFIVQPLEFSNKLSNNKTILFDIKRNRNSKFWDYQNNNFNNHDNNIGPDNRYNVNEQKDQDTIPSTLGAIYQMDTPGVLTQIRNPNDQAEKLGPRYVFFYGN